MWCEDEAGPFGTTPYPGSNWQPERKAACQEHEYIRNGTAKLLTLFHPATGQVRVKGVTSCTNAVLHQWLTEELASVIPQFVLWLCAHGIMPLYTPLGGSWLNMAESIQRILTPPSFRRASSTNDHSNHSVLGSYCSWMEPTTNTIRLGRVTGSTSRQSASETALSWWQYGSVKAKSQIK